MEKKPSLETVVIVLIAVAVVIVFGLVLGSVLEIAPTAPQPVQAQSRSNHLATLLSPVPTPEPSDIELIEELESSGAVEDPRKFVELLASGSSIVLGFLVSLALKHIPGWESRSSTEKRWISGGVTVAIATISGVLVMHVGDEVWEAIKPYWSLAMTAFMSWVAKEIAYLKFVKPSK